MSDNRKAKTMTLSGNEYAKVAERLLLFRSDWPRSKTESAHEFDVDQSVVFTVWLWKEKDALIDLMKSGVTDKELLRQSADANGTAKGEPKAKKDFEKLESIALGRALAMLGYLASGEIASFEEMEEYENFREQQQNDMIAEAIKSIKAAKSNDELNAIVKNFSAVLKFQQVIDAGMAKRAQLAQDEPESQAKPKPHPDAKKPASEPKTAPKLPLEADDANN